MIYTTSAILSEMAEFDICFVQVLDVVDKQSEFGQFRTVTVFEEIGYWLRTFHFNIFPNHKLFNDIEVGMTLKVKVISYLVILYKY